MLGEPANLAEVVKAVVVQRARRASRAKKDAVRVDVVMISGEHRIGVGSEAAEDPWKELRSSTSVEQRLRKKTWGFVSGLLDGEACWRRRWSLGRRVS